MALMNLPFLRGKNFSFVLKLKNGEQAKCTVKEMRLTLLRNKRAVEIDCFVERPDFWVDLQKSGLASLLIRVYVADGSVFEDEIRAGEDADAVLVLAEKLDAVLVKIKVADGV